MCMHEASWVFRLTQLHIYSWVYVCICIFRENAMVCEYVNALQQSASQPTILYICSSQNREGRSRTHLSNISSTSRRPTRPPHNREILMWMYKITHNTSVSVQYSIPALGLAQLLRIRIKIHQGNRAAKELAPGQSLWVYFYMYVYVWVKVPSVCCLQVHHYLGTILPNLMLSTSSIRNTLWQRAMHTDQVPHEGL